MKRNIFESKYSGQIRVDTHTYTHGVLIAVAAVSPCPPSCIILPPLPLRVNCRLGRTRIVNRSIRRSRILPLQRRVRLNLVYHCSPFFTLSQRTDHYLSLVSLSLLSLYLSFLPHHHTHHSTHSRLLHKPPQYPATGPARGQEGATTALASTGSETRRGSSSITINSGSSPLDNGRESVRARENTPDLASRTLWGPSELGRGSWVLYWVSSRVA